MRFGHSLTDAIDFEVETSEQVLVCALVRALKPRYAIETGCYHGITSRAIGEAIGPGHLDTMDTDDYSVDLTRQACVGLPVSVHHCASLDFIPDRPIDFMFLDSDVGDLRRRELGHFTPYLANEHVVVMHDSRDLPWPILDGWRYINLLTTRGLLLIQREP